MIQPYNREKAVMYAQKWALGRNPNYLDFENLGGDCTNFISQCIYAGSQIMNYTPTFGWYYLTSENRTASWTGVEYLYQFLTTNKGDGPFASVVSPSEIQPGDIIQLGNHRRYYHSLLVTKTGAVPMPYNIAVATHSFDTLNRILNTYTYHNIRYLHIEGVRKK